MGTKIEFFIHGVPKPAGSKRGFVTKKGKVAMVDASGQAGKDWRHDCKMGALEMLKKKFGDDSLKGPLLPRGQALRLGVTFIMPRPKWHFRTRNNGGDIKKSAPVFHIIKPDRTKLLRSVEDALTGILWEDDCQIVDGFVRKLYAEPHTEFCYSGAIVEVECIDD